MWSELSWVVLLLHMVSVGAGKSKILFHSRVFGASAGVAEILGGVQASVYSAPPSLGFLAVRVA